MESANSSIITISRKGASAETYKGQEIYAYDRIANYCKNSFTAIEKTYKKEHGRDCKIRSIDIMRASNGSIPRNTTTDIIPKEGDDDRYVWYNVNSQIEGQEVSSGWLCWDLFVNALDASAYAPFNVANNVDRYAEGVVRALEHMCKRGNAARCAQNEQPESDNSVIDEMILKCHKLENLCSEFVAEFNKIIE